METTIFTVLPNTYRISDPLHTDVRLRCPNCRHIGVFKEFADVKDILLQIPIAHGTDLVYLGQRICANPDCLAHIFFALKDGKVLVSYPAEHLDFDPSNIPKPIADALEEAIICHANRCFKAAAIMVRKTLEELCNAQGAKGPNLEKRIEALKGFIVLPLALLEGMHELRWLGNDAAHVASSVYDQVGDEEVRLGIDVAKEILKGVYQYTQLVSRLQARKLAQQQS